jgi:hypothetical protein
MSGNVCLVLHEVHTHYLWFYAIQSILIIFNADNSATKSKIGYNKKKFRSLSPQANNTNQATAGIGYTSNKDIQWNLYKAEPHGTENIFHIGQIFALYKINKTDSSGRDYRIYSHWANFRLIQVPPYTSFTVPNRVKNDGAVIRRLVAASKLRRSRLHPGSVHVESDTKCGIGTDNFCFTCQFSIWHMLELIHLLPRAGEADNLRPEYLGTIPPSPKKDIWEMSQRVVVLAEVY